MDHVEGSDHRNSVVLMLMLIGGKRRMRRRVWIMMMMMMRVELGEGLLRRVGVVRYERRVVGGRWW